MNREIKFRGQRIDNNQWVYGYYRKNTFYNKLGDEPKEIYTKHFIGAFDNKNLIDGIFEQVEVKPETICQFTGILDKANTEIYEGDFVSTDLQRPHNKVIYKNGAFMLECFDDNLYHDIFYPTHELQQAVYKYGQVIGNIIDNPELDAVPS